MYQSKFCLSVLFILSATMVKAVPVTVNNRAISEIAKPGQCVVFVPEKGASSVAFFFKDGNLSLGSMSFPAKTLEDVKGYYKKLIDQKDSFALYTGEELSLRSGLNSRYQNTYFEAKNKITAQAADTLTISSSLLKAEEICLVGKNITLENCHIIDPSIVRLEAGSKEALLQAVQFTFSDNRPSSALLQGTINMENGDMIDYFIVFGAQEIAVLFHEKAFK